MKGLPRSVLILVMATALSAIGGPEAPNRNKLTDIRLLLDSGRCLETEARCRQELARMGPADPAFGNGSRETAATLDLLVEALWRGGKAARPETRELALKAVALREKLPDPDPVERTRSLMNLATVNYLSGQVTAAQHHYRGIVATRETSLGVVHPDLANPLSALATTYAQQGDRASAARLYERALRLQRMAFGDSAEVTATTLTNLALLYLDNAEPALAVSYLQQALKIRERAFAADQVRFGFTLRHFASILSLAGDVADARPLLERAQCIWSRGLGERDPLVAFCLVDKANLEIGGDPDLRIRLLRQALILQEKAYGLDDARLAPVLFDLAGTLRAAGDGSGSEQERLYRRGLDLRVRALSSEDPRALPAVGYAVGWLVSRGMYAAARSLVEPLAPRNFEIVDVAALEKARSLESIAAGLAREGAADRAFEVALRAEDLSREGLFFVTRTLPEVQSMAIAAARHPGLPLALSLAVTRRDPDSHRRVFDALIRSRGLVLESLTWRRRTLSGTTDSTTVRLKELYAEANQRYSELLVRTAGGDASPEEAARVEEARDSFVDSEARLAARSVAFRKEKLRGHVGLSEVEKALPEQSALLSFARTDSDYVAFLIRARQPDCVLLRLGEAARIDAAILSWTQTLGGEGDNDSPPDEISSRAAGRAVRRSLWDPFTPYLAGITRLFVVPEGEVNQVSFAALPRETSGYLVEDAPAFDYLSAERDLVDYSTPGPLGTGLLAIGGPDFNSLLPAAAGSPPRADRKTDAPAETGVSMNVRTAPCSGLDEIRFTPLPGALAEVRDVVSLWHERRRSQADRERAVQSPARPGDSAVVLLSGGEATESSFKSLAPGRRLLHLATHGFIVTGECRPASSGERGIGTLSGAEGNFESGSATAGPLRLCGLALAGANERKLQIAGEDDGILTAEEIAAMDLSGAEWTVLSACATGLGKVERGEGVFGLRRAFEVAGARTLIMSLWPVEDEPTHAWMKLLYENRLMKKLDTMESVQQATLEVIHSRRRHGLSTSPVFWGAFVAAGDWH